MSVNQSRGEKFEGQLRRPGRSGSSGHNRGYSGGGGKGGAGGGGSGSAPSPASPISLSSSSAAPSSPSVPPLPPSTRSFKRLGNGQGGGQPRLNQASTSFEGSAVDASTATSHAAHNGSHLQSPLQGSLDAPAAAQEKPVITSLPRDSSHAVPRAPSMQSTSKASESSAPAALPKGNSGRPFALQFGTINPGIMNGLPIPARTSSAPPNLDEQKHNQALHDSTKAVPAMPLPSSPKQQQPSARKDTAGATQSNTRQSLASQSNSGQSHPPQQAKRDSHVPAPLISSVGPPRSSVMSMTGMPMSVPFQHQQQQVPLQFGRPNMQMQPQGVVPSSIQMTMALPGGSVPQVPQQMFVPGIQAHALPQQALMHQGQGLSFAPGGHQLAPQLGNMGIGIGPQYPQQQPGKFVAPRKTTVKITHPDTHEELKLDKRMDSHMGGSSSVPRLLPTVTPQSQSIPTFTHHMSYYPASYNPPPIYFPTTSVPLTSSQMPSGSQAPRYSYPGNQSGHPITFMNSSVLNQMSGAKPVPTHLHGVSDGGNLENLQAPVPSAPVQITVRPPVGLHGEKAGTPSVTINMQPNKAEAPRLLRAPEDAPVSHQQKTSEVILDSSVPPIKSVSNPVDNVPSTFLDRILPFQQAIPEISSTLITPVSDFQSTVDGPNEKKREPLQRTGSLKEHQKKANRKNVKQSQQPQSDALNYADDVKSEADGSASGSAKTSQNLQASAEIDLTSLLSSLPSSDSQTRMPLEGGTAEVEGTPIHVISSSFGVGLEKEPSQCMPCGNSSMSSSTGAQISVKSSESSETSAPIGIVANGEMPNFLDFEGEQCGSVEVQEAEKPAVVQSDETKVSGGAKLYPDSGTQQSEVDLVKPEVAGTYDSAKVDAVVEGYENQQVDVPKEDAALGLDDDNAGERSNMSDITSRDSSDANPVCSSFLMSANAAVSSLPDAYADGCGPDSSQGSGLTSSGISSLEVVPAPDSAMSESIQKDESKAVDPSDAGPVCSGRSVPKEKHVLEIAKAKSITGKKKRQEMLSKADAAGASDLYNAYKGPEGKHENGLVSERMDSCSAGDITHLPPDASEKDTTMSEEDGQIKVEPDDWEDAADISTPNLTSVHVELVNVANNLLSKDGNEAYNRKYSRDFLLTFAQQCTELPIGFQVVPDIADALMVALVGKTYIVDREPIPSPGRIIDRPGISRGDRRTACSTDDDRWTKSAGPFSPGRDSRLDAGNGPSVMNFRPGQGVSHGVLRNPRGQAPGQFSGGILSGPMQPVTSHGGLSRSVSDLDRWQHATGIQRGLIPSPATPLQVMHKAEKKYEVGKVSDKEEAKQRQLKGILNKLTPQNFDKLFAQVKEVNIDNPITLTGVISQIFDKALTEPTFCEMYANFCSHLASALPDFSEDNEKITFKRLLLNKCQEEFERGEREQAEADKTEEEGEIKQSKEEREEKRLRARRHMLGNIRLIGELYKKKMLTERIMHECIKKLLGQCQNPDEEDIEALCKLMSTIGEMIDHPKAKEHMDAYFDMLLKLSANQKLSSRVRFMLKDAIDLRKNKWHQRRKVEGPKKIEEVHRDAAQERQAQASRSARGPIICSATRRGPPADYGLRGSTGLASPPSHQVGSRGSSSQVRGYGTQDVRMDDRHQFDGRTGAIPLPQRSNKDDSLTLVPQGGLGRNMSSNRQPTMSNVTSAEALPVTGDYRRTVSGPNGYNSVADWTSSSIREDRITADRFPGASHDQPGLDDHSSASWNSRIADHTSDRSSANTQQTGRVHGSGSSNQDIHSETKTLSAEVLRERSLLAVREFYSAKDEKEVALCVEELNASSFYPSIISLWIMDSFERKDMERDFLTKLLLALCKPQDGLFNQLQLIQGLESVLSLLEDAKNDAPRAPQFLGRLFAKLVLGNVVSLREIGRLIREGGEEPGCLVEVGLAADVLGSTLETIRVDKGDPFINGIQARSDLKMEDFLPPPKNRKS